MDNNIMDIEETINDVASEVEATADEIVTEDNVDAFKLLNMVAQMNDMKSLVEEIKGTQKKTAEETCSKDSVDLIDEKAALLTSDEIMAMTKDQIIGVFSDDDGNPYEFMKMDNPAEDIEFKRDYLMMRCESIHAISGLDAEIAKMEEAMKEYETDINKLIETFGNMTNYLIMTFEEKRDNAETDEEREKYSNMIIAIRDALTLNTLKEFYSNHVNRRNVIPNFALQSKSKQIQKKYEMVRKAFKSRTNLFNFGDIEKKCLPEKYHERNNLFVFSVINMVATWTKCTTRENIINGMFLSQFNVNLKNLIYDKFDNEDEKNTFVTSICEVLDMIM